MQKRKASSWVTAPWVSAAEGLGALAAEAACKASVASRMLWGLVALVVAASVLLRYNASAAAAAAAAGPVTAARPRAAVTVLLFLGLACGPAGYAAVNSVGGSGLRWLILWEAICAVHALASWYTALLYRALYGRPPGAPPPEKGEEAADGHLAAAEPSGAMAALPAVWLPAPWLRQVAFHSVLVFGLPVLAGVVPFLPAGEYTRLLALAARRAAAAAGLGRLLPPSFFADPYGDPW